MFLAASVLTDPNTWFAAALVVFTIPVGILAWRSLQDRNERMERDTQIAEDKRLTEHVLRAIAGDEALKDPKKIPPNRPSLVETVDMVAHQVKPVNGNTLAQEMYRLAVLIGEHMSDGHGGQVWPGVK